MRRNTGRICDLYCHFFACLSLCHENTEEEVETVLTKLPEIVKNLRAMSPLTPEYLR